MKVTNINIGGYKLWKKFCLVLALLSLLSLPLSAESETELTVPDLEPEAVYEMAGQDIMTLYQTVIDLNETKTEYKNLTNEMMETLNDAKTLAQEYERENKKLQLQNKLLIGGITVSVGVVVVGAIFWACTK